MAPIRSRLRELLGDAISVVVGLAGYLAVHLTVCYVAGRINQRPDEG